MKFDEFVVFLLTIELCDMFLILASIRFEVRSFGFDWREIEDVLDEILAASKFWNDSDADVKF